MSPVTLLLISLGVSADAFAVAIGKGLQSRRLRKTDAVRLAATFGAFQAAMPVLGFLVGRALRDYVTAIDHWVAFVLLGVIGARMVWQAATEADGGAGHDSDAVPWRELLLLGLATSIDALAVGISLAFLDVSIVTAAAVIGVTTFVLSLVGVVVGHRVGAAFRRPAGVVGGLVLIGIGTQILVEHLTA